MRLLKVFVRWVVGIALVALGLGAEVAIAATLYVYELPDGSRLVSDHALNNKHYRLVRTGKDARGLGQLAASRNSQFFRAKPDAYDELIRQVAQEHELDFALVKAIMHVESAFNPYAVSDKGALGLMQLMPETARRYGIHDLYDPHENIRAAVRYLKDLNAMFGNKQALVIAAYNAGEKAVMRYKGIPPYQETQLYVRKVLKYKRHYAEQS
jgi:soluble lytic murein transglycosylase-like protein